MTGAFRQAPSLFSPALLELLSPEKVADASRLGTHLYELLRGSDGLEGTGSSLSAAVGYLEVARELLAGFLDERKEAEGEDPCDPPPWRLLDAVEEALLEARGGEVPGELDLREELALFHKRAKRFKREVLTLSDYLEERYQAPGSRSAAVPLALQGRLDEAVWAEAFHFMAHGGFADSLVEISSVCLDEVSEEARNRMLGGVEDYLEDEDLSWSEAREKVESTGREET